MTDSIPAKSPPRVMKLNNATYSSRFEYGDHAEVVRLCGAINDSLLLLLCAIQPTDGASLQEG